MFLILYRYVYLTACLLTLVMLVPVGSVYAQASNPTPRYEIELRSDNDMYLFILQDQYYTNGLFLNLRRTFDESKLRSNEKNRLLEWEVGHEIYNAYTAQIDSIEAIDRAITAHLYVAAGVHHYLTGEGYVSYKLGLGTIGKRAFGQLLQEGLHYLLNMYHASGWEYQLKNAWTIDLSLNHQQLLLRTENEVFDLSVHSHMRVGTYQLKAGTGPLFRLGKLLTFDQSAHLSSRLQSRGAAVPKEWYVFYRPEVHAMLYDVTLQGGLFLADKGPVTSEPRTWRMANNFGAALANQHLSMKVQYHFLTKEAKQSFFRHQYGSVSLAYRF